MEKHYLAPAEVAEYVRDVGVKKANTKVLNTVILAFMAGMFVAFASQGTAMASFNLLSKPETYGLGKALMGAYFAIALMFVVIAGGELFTGNTLIIVSVLEKKTPWLKMFRNWVLVYFGNMAGGVFISYLINLSLILDSGGNLLGGTLLKIASSKVELPFVSLFVMGIMCNIIVCLAVYMAYAAHDIAGKCLSMFFAISLFACSGYEHSVANMFYIPVAIMAKSNPNWVAASGLSPEKLANINLYSFFVDNLIPVTLGNILGGALFVGVVYWFVYIKNSK